MSETKIYDLNPYPINNRTSSYGGQAGDKEGITINDEYWIVKYPKSTKGMIGNLASLFYRTFVRIYRKPYLSDTWVRNT